MKFAEVEKEEKLLMKEDDSEGIKYLFCTNMMKSSQVFFTDMMKSSKVKSGEDEIYEIFATEISLEQQNTPEVIAAKQVEYDNYVKFDAFEEVKDVGQERLKTQWVCSRKEK